MMEKMSVQSPGSFGEGTLYCLLIYKALLFYLLVLFQASLDCV